MALAEAGMTWESVAGWLQGPITAAAWEALVPSMGYMAKLRNLRNFDEAGISDEVATRVAAELSDPEAVRTSRQLPLRFLSAYRTAAHDRWKGPLEQALQHSLRGVPRLSGRTLILIDTSGSMTSRFSRDGTLRRWNAARMFGLALAQACDRADVVSYSHDSKVFSLRRGENLLRAVDRWQSSGYFLNGGTYTTAAVERHYRRHDRIVVLTDEQAADGPVQAGVPMYTWNLAGYRYGHAPSGTGRSHTFAGLNDASFGMIALLEAGRNANWPF
ncbi:MULTISPECIES: TROVE domain-containing protein [Amycolatopsis]|uniref:TROVE domain-containing protein n=1 Tax=Amycolatopsis TaxID=1813 RepID=UPI000A77A663|nr:VWA domain-containing protein [Amycolatopsis sacchari]